MVKSTGTGPAGSSMSLKDVVKEIRETNKKLDAQGTALTDFIAEIRFQRQGQGLENKREARKSKGGGGVPLVSPIANLSKDGLGLGFFLNPASLLKGLTSNLGGIAAGIAAVTLATDGLRGWALTPVKSIKKWASWGDKIVDGAKGIRNALFLSFGLTEAGELSRDSKGRFKKTPITTKIGMRMNAFRIAALQSFGLGPTGELVEKAKPDPKLMKKNLFQRFKFQFGRIMNPIKNITAGIAKFASGAGSKIFDFFSKIGALGGGSVGKIAGVFVKILKPLGFFLSFKAAFDDWMTTKESSIMKQGTDFIGKFLGNFLGAPADLIKSLIFKVAEFVGFEVDKDGVFQKLKDASFEDLLTAAFQNILDIPRKVFDFAVKAFTEEGFVQEQFKILKNKVVEVFKGVFTGIAKVLKKAFGMEDEESEESAEMKRFKRLNAAVKAKKINKERLSKLKVLDINNDGIIDLDEFSYKNLGGLLPRTVTKREEINSAFGQGKNSMASQNFLKVVKELGGLDLRAAEAKNAQPIVIDNSTVNGPSSQNITNLTASGDVSEAYSRSYMRSLFDG